MQVMYGGEVLHRARGDFRSYMFVVSLEYFLPERLK